MYRVVTGTLIALALVVVAGCRQVGEEEVGSEPVVATNTASVSFTVSGMS